jgi:hypothetical protein
VLALRMASRFRVLLLLLKPLLTFSFRFSLILSLFIRVSSFLYLLTSSLPIHLLAPYVPPSRPLSFSGLAFSPPFPSLFLPAFHPLAHVIYSSLSSYLRSPPRPCRSMSSLRSHGASSTDPPTPRVHPADPSSPTSCTGSSNTKTPNHHRPSSTSSMRGGTTPSRSRRSRVVCRVWNGRSRSPCGKQIWGVPHA